MTGAHFKWQTTGGDPGYNLNEKFLSGKNNETVYFYCILNEESIDPPCVPVASYLRHNNRTAASSGLIWRKKKKEKAICWLKKKKTWTILSSQIIKVKCSCNCCLKKIVSTLSSSQKGTIFDPRVFFLFCLNNTNKKHLPWTIQLCGDTPEGERVVSIPEGGGTRCSPIHPVQHMSWGGGTLSAPTSSPLSSFSEEPQVDLPAYVSGSWAANDLFK